MILVILVLNLKDWGQVSSSYGPYSSRDHFLKNFQLEKCRIHPNAKNGYISIVNPNGNPSGYIHQTLLKTIDLSESQISNLKEKGASQC